MDERRHRWWNGQQNNITNMNSPLIIGDGTARLTEYLARSLRRALVYFYNFSERFYDD